MTVSFSNTNNKTNTYSFTGDIFNYLGHLYKLPSNIKYYINHYRARLVYVCLEGYFYNSNTKEELSVKDSKLILHITKPFLTPQGYFIVDPYCSGLFLNPPEKDDINYTLRFELPGSNSLDSLIHQKTPKIKARDSMRIYYVHENHLQEISQTEIEVLAALHGIPHNKLDYSLKEGTLDLHEQEYLRY